MINYETISSGLDSSTDTLIARAKLETPLLTPEVMAALHEFDMTNIPVHEAINVVGVFSGVKPAAILDDIEDDSKKLFSHMGLVWEDADAETTVLSRHQELADTMVDLYKRGGCRTRDAQMQRSVGKLLGFPETATEYYIKRLESYHDTDILIPDIEFPGLEWSGVNGGMRNFKQFILSPDHAEEEVKQYSEPLRQATEIMTPHLYDRILEKSETVSFVDLRSNFLTRVVRYLGERSVFNTTKSKRPK